MAREAFLNQLGNEQLRIVRTQPYPQRWNEFCRQYQLDWNFTPFEKQLANQVDNVPGIYCFHIGHFLNCLPSFGISLYGGITSRCLRTRFLEYFRERDAEGGRKWVRKFLLVFDGELSFAWSPIDIEVYDIDELERQFNDAMMPPYSVKDLSADVKAGRYAWS